MEEFLINYGLLSLFLLSLLASTLIPLGSEWLLVTLLLQGVDPVWAVGLATAGNTLGACTTYLIGLYGGDYLVRKVLRISAEARERAGRSYARYGSWSLLLSWLPVIGDPLCLVGGLLKVQFRWFLLLVCSGKLARYLAVCWLTLGVAG
ncbi:MAG: DedA family protein [Desulfuromonadales bacterium]|nr:DedA family protein [Desulfuromonadales bacterium]